MEGKKRKIKIKNDKSSTFCAVVPSVTQSVTHISIVILYFNRKPSTHLALTLTLCLQAETDVGNGGQRKAANKIQEE